VTSIAEQTVAEMGGRFSVLSLQKRDHLELNRLLHRLTIASPADQDAVLLDIYRLVFPHAYAEETVLWPAIRRVLPDGHELTLRIEREHQQINEVVTRLEALQPGSPDRRPVLEELIGLLWEDVRDEEDILLPRFQAAVSRAQLWRLGIAWEAVRRTAPTRAHPVVSRRPPGNVLAALPLALLDRCRDRVDARLLRRPGRFAAPLCAVGSALTAASHGVERLPGMQRGESRETRLGRKRRFGWGAAALLSAAGMTALALMARRRSKSAPSHDDPVSRSSIGSVAPA